MVIIRNWNWGDFEGKTIEEAKQKMFQDFIEHDTDYQYVESIEENGVELDAKKTDEYNMLWAHDFYVEKESSEIDAAGYQLAAEEAYGRSIR